MLKYKAISRNREKYGLTLSDLSKKTGLNKEQLSRLETGKALNPTLRTLELIAKALHLKITDLIDESQITA